VSRSLRPTGDLGLAAGDEILQFGVHDELLVAQCQAPLQPPCGVEVAGRLEVGTCSTVSAHFFVFGIRSLILFVADTNP